MNVSRSFSPFSFTISLKMRWLWSHSIWIHLRRTSLNNFLNCVYDFFFEFHFKFNATKSHWPYREKERRRWEKQNVNKMPESEPLEYNHDQFWIKFHCVFFLIHPLFLFLHSHAIDTATAVDAINIPIYYYWKRSRKWAEQKNFKSMVFFHL